MTTATRDSGLARQLRIGEVARLTGVPVKTIRFYADRGILPPATTTAAGYRVFAAGDVWRLDVIRVLRSLGFGLDRIREVLSKTEGVGDALTIQRRAIAEQLASLGRNDAILAQVEARLSAGTLDEAESLDYIRQIAETMASDAATRERWLSEILDHRTGGRWRAGRSEPATTWDQSDVDPPDAERAAILTDLRRRTSAEGQEPDLENAPSELDAALAGSDGSPDEWGDDYAAIGRRMREAAERGESPEGAFVQAILDDWLAAFARLRGGAVNPDLIRWLADAAPTWVAPGSDGERFWRAAHGSEPSSHERGEALLLDALAVRRRALG